jgi:nitroreductase
MDSHHSRIVACARQYLMPMDSAYAGMFEVMSTMRAMRRLKPDPVPDDLLTRVVEAATWAPSAANIQGYSFLVVTDRNVMTRLAELWRLVCDFYLDAFWLEYPDPSEAAAADRALEAIRHQRDHFHETPALIVACYRLIEYRGQLRRHPRRFATALRRLGPRRSAILLAGMPALESRTEAASIYPAVQNLLLAARALGLAANLTCWHLLLEAEFKAVLGIPRRVHTFALIPVGWPIGRFGSTRRRAAAELIHRDRW